MHKYFGDEAVPPRKAFADPALMMTSGDSRG